MPKNHSTREIPRYESLFSPTVEALQILGGSGTTDEIYDKVVEILGLPEDVTAVPHGDTGRTEVEYQLAWSRTYLKKSGLLENSARGVWSLTPAAKNLDKLDPREITKAFRASTKSHGSDTSTSNGRDVTAEEAELEAVQWEVRLHHVLMSLQPAAFERLIQRLLRESGFIQVQVTGKSGDGGIDGIGIARINGFLSFHVLFQCKRYQGSVTPSQIRDFRGAMQGRTDKGLFVTTGTFTRDAVTEATRDGAPPIDLIDGEQLVHRLKELGLGVKVKMIEAVEVDTDWLERL
jgi:restriction system protein